MALKLVIGNKNYSSWSMRPWLALRANDIPFEEVFIPLYTDDKADKDRILSFHAFGQGAGADRRRRHDLGFAGDHRISGRTISGSKAVAGGPRAPRACAVDFGGNAFGLHAAAQRMRHEPASAGRRRSSCRTTHAPMSRAFRRSGSIAASGTARSGRSCSGPSAAADAMFAPVVHRFRTYAIEVAPRGAGLYGDDDGVAGLRGMDPRGPRRNPRDREVRDGLSPSDEPEARGSTVPQASFTD